MTRTRIITRRRVIIRIKTRTKIVIGTSTMTRKWGLNRPGLGSGGNVGDRIN
jgi:hypothetical protein